MRHSCPYSTFMVCSFLKYIHLSLTSPVSSSFSSVAHCTSMSGVVSASYEEYPVSISLPSYQSRKKSSSSQSYSSRSTRLGQNVSASLLMLYVIHSERASPSSSELVVYVFSRRSVGPPRTSSFPTPTTLRASSDPDVSPSWSQGADNILRPIESYFPFCSSRCTLSVSAPAPLRTSACDGECSHSPCVVSSLVADTSWMHE